MSRSGVSERALRGHQDTDRGVATRAIRITSAVVIVTMVGQLLVVQKTDGWFLGFRSTDQVELIYQTASVHEYCYAILLRLYGQRASQVIHHRRSITLERHRSLENVDVFKCLMYSINRPLRRQQSFIDRNHCRKSATKSATSNILQTHRLIMPDSSPSAWYPGSHYAVPFSFQHRAYDKNAMRNVYTEINTKNQQHL